MRIHFFKHLKNYVNLKTEHHETSPIPYKVHADINKHWKIKFCAKHTGTVEIGCELSMLYSFIGKGHFNYCHEQIKCK